MTARTTRRKFDKDLELELVQQAMHQACRAPLPLADEMSLGCARSSPVPNVMAGGTMTGNRNKLWLRPVCSLWRIAGWHGAQTRRECQPAAQMGGLLSTLLRCCGLTSLLTADDADALVPVILNRASIHQHHNIPMGPAIPEATPVCQHIQIQQ